MTITHDMCPSAEAILAAVEHPTSVCSDADAVFRHLLDCRECRGALTFVCAAVALEQDRKRQQLLWRRFRAKVSNGLVFRNSRLDGECIDAIAAGMPAALILEASVPDSDIHFWRATMTFPDVDQPKAPLTIRVDDANGSTIQDGQFIIFGVEIPIINGVGCLSRVQLAECHHKGGSAFRWQDGCLVSGAPVLNT